MERYSAFNDERTGVNPFTTPPPRLTWGGLATAVLLWVVKTPLLLVALLLLALSHLLVAIVRWS